MMSRTLRFYFIAVIAALVIFGFIFLVFPGSVTVGLASGELATAGGTVTVDQNKQSQPLPATVKLRAGHHRLVITPTNKLTQIDEVNPFVWPFSSQTITVTPTEGDLPGARGAAENPYISFFPRITDTYRLEGEYTDDLSKLTAVDLTIYHQANISTNPGAYQAERDQAIGDAKAYLASVKVPSTIPLVISDQ